MPHSANPFSLKAPFSPKHPISPQLPLQHIQFPLKPYFLHKSPVSTQIPLRHTHFPYGSGYIFCQAKLVAQSSFLGWWSLWGPPCFYQWLVVQQSTGWLEMFAKGNAIALQVNSEILHRPPFTIVLSFKTSWIGHFFSFYAIVKEN